jgi:hypothetical protein
MKRYKVILNEKQLRAVMQALELRFRIDFGQDYELSEILATKSIDLSPDNPAHNRLFDIYIERRDNIHNMLKALFEIARPFWAESKRNEQAMICQDVWGVFRHQLWKDDPNHSTSTVDSQPPLQISGIELPTIERISDDNSK